VPLYHLDPVLAFLVPAALLILVPPTVLAPRMLAPRRMLHRRKTRENV
jgi:hypothetical protein